MCVCVCGITCIMYIEIFVNSVRDGRVHTRARSRNRARAFPGAINIEPARRRTWEAPGAPVALYSLGYDSTPQR